MDISIIIVNYNTSSLVKDCIDSIFEKECDLSFEILVVDNNSLEDDLTLLKNDSRIKLIESEENIGFGRANNLGAKKACGEYLFFLNPDTVLVNNAISKLYNFLISHTEAAIAGGNLYDNSMKPNHSFRRMYPGFVTELDFILRRVITKALYGRNNEFNNTSKELEVAYITGADLIIRKNVFEQLQGFDPAFFMYSEETDLCKRCRDLGYKVMSVPEAKIIHLEGKSFVNSQPRESRIQHGRYIYFHKHHNCFYNYCTDALNIVSLLASLFFYRNNQKKREIYKYRLSIYLKLLKHGPNIPFFHKQNF